MLARIKLRRGGVYVKNEIFQGEDDTYRFPLPVVSDPTVVVSAAGTRNTAGTHLWGRLQHNLSSHS